nr:hypothetical protein B0A51_02141 [Rachicladosporium sp. CCFEE 5018]
MSAPPDEQQQSSSYLTSIAKYSPWSRSPVVPASKGANGEPEPLPPQQQGGDHVVKERHRLSLRKYPRDCPVLRPQWFHAVDVPKRRPNPAGEAKEAVKPPGKPKKYAAFSTTDSKAIEFAFRKSLDDEESHGRKSDSQSNKSLKAEKQESKYRVPVNEDYLFDVDVEQRELGPAYWLGPVYDVRRGTWFYQDGAVQRPCDESLAAQLEDGYLKVKAWRLPGIKQDKEKARSASQPRPRPTSWAPGQAAQAVGDALKPSSLTPKASISNLREQANQTLKAAAEEGQEPQQENTYRLFGSHMNSVVTYQDSTTAWLLTDDFLSRMNYSMYQRFAGGGHFAGVKVTRGWIMPGKKVESTDTKPEDSTKQSTSTEDDAKESNNQADQTGDEEKSPSTLRRQNLERHMSTLLDNANNPEEQDEEVRRRDEREIEDDYREIEGDDQGREIDHLILVTHGIGQRLGLRLESVNFVHDVNTLRKTVKAVYAESPDLRALNAELDDAAKTNSTVQVLPICWRHLLDFPKQSLRHNRGEHDLGDSGFGEEEEYPNLADISVEGVPAVRNLITDLALDILLYQSPAYKDHISRIVLDECNRIYHLFMDRNPDFKGKVSMIGHSLGSAIMFDILCRQDRKSDIGRKDIQHGRLDFEVEDFYALGSPIGLFQMLKGRTIAARETPSRSQTARMSDDPMLDVPSSKTNSTNFGTRNSEIPVSSPKCSQIYNIFHPTDPISYRIEPFISPAMAALKPQPLPYTKRGIFGAPVGQGLTGIGTRVGQSVSSLWTSMSSGLASSLLTRGLGYTGEENSSNPLEAPKTTQSILASSKPSAGAGTNLGAGVLPPPPAAPPATSTDLAAQSANKQTMLAAKTLTSPPSDASPSQTLISSDIQTLYTSFEARRASISSQHKLNAPHAAPSAEMQEAKERGEKFKKEEAKVRRLNANGRVDYAIQEGAFDINLLAAIASHLSYWADEDVGHFVLSQLLSKGKGMGTPPKLP